MGLLSDFPSLVEEFDFSRNQLIPGEIPSGSNKNVWWVCSSGHCWQASPYYRVSGFGSCAVCLSLTVLQPELAAQWHPTRNNGLLPEQVRPGSGKKVWWLGECGHEWEMVVKNRVKQKQGCPFCGGQRVELGVNDLTTTHPHFASFWHPTRNAGLSADEVSAGSKREVWWVCEAGHEWKMSVAARVRGRAGCRVCSSVAASVFSGQWHPTKNGSLTPQDVSAGSKVKVWWLGECGHEWVQSPGSRVMNIGSCLVCSNQTVMAGVNDLETLNSLLASEWDTVKNSGLLPSEVTVGSNRKVWWLCENAHSWSARVSDRNYGSGCPECNWNTWVSDGERKIADFIRGCGVEVRQSVRDVIKGEIDILIPGKKVGVEFNGLYWHSEAVGKNHTYHHDKWAAAKQAGVQLIQIWEDDWNRNPDLIKRMLAHKLGVSQERTVYARRTRVVDLATVDAQLFLDGNHIQGYASASYYLGLRDIETDETLAVLALKKEAGTDGRVLNIVRYATSANVVGGFTKLLTHAERMYKPESFITFADHCVSDGGLYENNGFVADKELAPDYMYVVKGERKHKFGYRLRKFRDDPTLKYEDGLTERELASLNNLPRIWDAGKTRYVKQTSFS